MNKKENKFLEMLYKVFFQYNVGLAVLALVTAFAYAVSFV